MRLLTILILLLTVASPAQADGPPAGCDLLTRQIRAPIAPSDQAPAYACLLPDGVLWWRQYSLAHQMTIAALDSADQHLASTIVRTTAIGWHATTAPTAEGAIVLSLTESRADTTYTVYYLLPQPPNYLPVTAQSAQPCWAMPLRPITVPAVSRICGAIDAQSPAGRLLTIEWELIDPAINIPARIELLDAEHAVLWTSGFVTSPRAVERVQVSAPTGAVAFNLCLKWEGCVRHELPPWRAVAPLVR